MIEQVLYRRTAQGYVEYFSGGLSKEEAHKVNIVMDKVASGINDLGSGADSPFLLYPFDTMKRFCLAIFQKEYSGGRSNSVNHGLLIDEEEYKELVKDPDQIWGFTNKNFLSRKVNSRNEMPGLKALDISENFELNKDFIFKEYNLKNSGYLKFLNAVYMSLSKNRNYQFGIQIDNSKDANKVMRHFGYLITSMLPYELRDKVSFCSRNVPESIKVTLRILTEKDTKKTDIIYDINTAECILSNSNLEIIDFYLSDLLEMSDLGLREYFATLDAFRNELKVSKDSEAQYAVLKLLKLSQNPSLFALETAQNQISFINDVFSLETSNTDVINSIVVRLLPFVDSKYYIEAFNLNFELYGKLDSYKESDKRIMAKVEENIIQNYSNATVKEREQLFKSVFSSGQTHKKVQKILENCIEANEIDTDVMLVDEYIKLYEEFFDTEWKSALYSKIAEVFKKGDIDNKKKIWKRIYNSTNPGAKILLIYKILYDEDEVFQKAVFDEMVSLYLEAQNAQFKERLYKCIGNVINKEDDKYRLQILSKYNNSSELEGSLWTDTYNAIKDYKSAATDLGFLKCLKDKYYNSKNEEISNLYLEYIGHAPISALENIICQYSKLTKTDRRDKLLVDKIIYFLTKHKKKISIDVLKTFALSVKDEEANKLASYISNLYLEKAGDESNEIYLFLEKEQEDLYNNSCLNKEELPSFDSYCASKLEAGVLDDDNLLSMIKGFEGLKYNKESFSKLNLLCQKDIESEFSKAKTDYERFVKYGKLSNKLDNILFTRFGEQYCESLKDYAQDIFWKESSINTFDYEHCDIYRSNSEVYDIKFEKHENHVLANTLSGLIKDSFADGDGVDWDRVYSILLSKNHIFDDGARDRIGKDFIKQYNDYGMPESDPDYIAFDSVDKGSLKMDYPKLLDNLNKHNHPFDDKSIRSMRVFNYIQLSTLLKKKLSDYGNYQSDNPQYREVLSCLRIEQIVFALLLLLNNFLSGFIIKIFNTVKTVNLLLLCNYAGHVILIIAVSFVSIFMMLRANLRRSTVYDKYVFGVLIINMLCSTIATLLSIKVTNAIVCCLIPIIFMGIAIFMNIQLDNVIRKTRREIKLGDDIYG